MDFGGPLEYGRNFVVTFVLEFCILKCTDVKLHTSLPPSELSILTVRMDRFWSFLKIFVQARTQGRKLPDAGTYLHGQLLPFKSSLALTSLFDYNLALSTPER